MGNYLFVANAGDCRAVLGRRKKGDQHEQFEAIQITKDHTAYEEEERIRREHPDEEDVVIDGTIKGNLEPSRAIGDALFKHDIFNKYLK